MATRIGGIRTLKYVFLFLISCIGLAWASGDGAKDASQVERPKPLIEWGGDFLGTGELPALWLLPTGAVWSPQFVLFGTVRTSWSAFSLGEDEVQEGNIRLDLNANLQLSGTERLVVGFRHFDQDGRFSRYVVEDPAGETGGRSEFNTDIRSLFFEGDLGEIFPALNNNDQKAWDLGFAVGRLPLQFQDGMLLDDTVDAIGLTRNTLLPRGTSNLRMTAIWAWDGVTRNAALEDDGGMFGIFSAVDLRRTTLELDLAYVDDENEKGFASALSAKQRQGYLNTTYRLMLTSNDQSEDGLLVFTGFSWAPKGTHDHMYVNGFGAFGQVASASRSGDTGGVLTPVGVSFSGTGLGRYPAVISASGNDTAGGAIGYQRFMTAGRQQLLFELAGRFATDHKLRNEAREQWAMTARYQSALASRYVVRVDGFLRRLDGLVDVGARCELLIQL